MIIQSRPNVFVFYQVKNLIIRNLRKTCILTKHSNYVKLQLFLFFSDSKSFTSFSSFHFFFFNFLILYFLTLFFSSLSYFYFFLPSFLFLMHPFTFFFSFFTVCFCFRSLFFISTIHFLLFTYFSLSPSFLSSSPSPFIALLFFYLSSHSFLFFTLYLFIFRCSYLSLPLLFHFPSFCIPVFLSHPSRDFYFVLRIYKTSLPPPWCE